MHINFKIYDLVLITIFILILSIKFLLFPEAEYLTALALTIFAVGLLHITRSNQTLINKTYLQGQKNFNQIEKNQKNDKNTLIKSFFKEFQFTNFLIKKENEQLLERTEQVVDVLQTGIEKNFQEETSFIKDRFDRVTNSLQSSKDDLAKVKSDIISQHKLERDHNAEYFNQLKSASSNITHSLSQAKDVLIELYKAGSNDQLRLTKEVLDLQDKLGDKISVLQKEANKDRTQLANSLSESQQALGEKIIEAKKEIIINHKEESDVHHKKLSGLIAESARTFESLNIIKNEIITTYNQGNQESISLINTLVDTYNNLGEQLNETKIELGKFHLEGNSDFMQGINNLLASHDSLSTQIFNTKEELYKLGQQTYTEGTVKLESVINAQKEVKDDIRVTSNQLLDAQNNINEEHQIKLDGLLNTTINLSTQIKNTKQDLIQLHTDSISSQVENANIVQESQQEIKSYITQAYNQLTNLQKEGASEHSKRINDIVQLYGAIEKTIPKLKSDLIKEQKSASKDIKSILNKNSALIDSFNKLNSFVENMPPSISIEELNNEIMVIKSLLEGSVAKLTYKIEAVRASEDYAPLLSSVDVALDNLLNESRTIQETTQKNIDLEIDRVVKSQDQNFYNLKYELLNGLEEKQEHLLTSFTNETAEEKIVLGNIYINTIIQQLDKEPIIIGGCGRSGSTLLLSMFSAHPKILTIPKETYVFSPDAYNPKMHHDNPFDLHKLYHEHISKLDILPTHDRWCEKSPKNVLFFERILEYYPSARIIHLVRDGRDVILSKHPRNPSEYWISEERWINDVSKGLELVDHPNVLTVKYEDLVTNYDETMANICNHVHVDYNYHLKKWHRFAKIRSNEAWFGEVEPIYSSSIGKWKNKENQQKVENFMRNKRAVNLLKELKYELPIERSKVKKMNA